MAMPQIKATTHTVAEWATWEGSWELLDGVAYAMAPPGLQHQRVSSDLHGSLWAALREHRKRPGHEQCEVLSAPTGLFLPGSETALQPDLMVVCDPSVKSDRGVEGPPDLVVEIQSPTTASRDYTRKWWTYEAAGIPEYLLVDPVERVARLLRLEDGRYVDAARVEWGDPLELLGGDLKLRLGEGPE